MFTLQYFGISHRHNTLYDCQFARGFQGRNKALCSLVIGENGSGKSYLLSQIVEFFKFLKTIRVNQEKQRRFRYQNAKIVYILNGDVYNVELEEKDVLVEVNGKTAELSALKFPKALLALSFMVNDKFVYSGEQDKFYNT